MISCGCLRDGISVTILVLAKGLCEALPHLRGGLLGRLLLDKCIRHQFDDIHPGDGSSRRWGWSAWLQWKCACKEQVSLPPALPVGAANAIKVMPQFVNVVHRTRDEACPPDTSPASSRSGTTTGQGLLNVGKGMESDMWQLLTAHENGQCLLWDISDPMSFQPIARLSVPGHPAKYATVPHKPTLA